MNGKIGILKLCIWLTAKIITTRNKDRSIVYA